MARYESWGGAKGLASKIGAFVDGSANFLKALGISSAFAIALMGVFVASFAATTLDTACRLQRYVIQELASTMGSKKNPFKLFQNKHAATTLAVILAFSVAATPAPGADWSIQNAGKGGLNLWPLFGATNQLLAGLAFLVILFWMRRRKISLWFILIPAVFMLFLPGMAMIIELFREGGWIKKGNYLLVSFGIATLALEIWMIIEAVIAWPKVKGLMEEPIPDIIINSDAENEGGRSC